MHYAARRAANPAPPPSFFKGTGKTTIAEFWAEILGQLDLRPADEDEIDDDNAVKLKDPADEAHRKNLETLQKTLKAAVAIEPRIMRLEEELKCVQQSRRAARNAKVAIESGRPYTLNYEPPWKVQHNHLCKQADTFAKALNKFETDDSERKVVERLERARKKKAQDDERERKAEEKKKKAALANGDKKKKKKKPARLVMTDGAELAQEGLDFFNSAVMPMLSDDLERKGGVVFIDEAHNLMPATSSNGAAVVRRIVKLAADYKNCLTFIVAGVSTPTRIPDLLFAHSLSL